MGIVELLDSLKKNNSKVNSGILNYVLSIT